MAHPEQPEGSGTKRTLIPVAIAVIIVIAAGAAVFFSLPKAPAAVAKTGDNVTVFYTLSIDNGTTFPNGKNETKKIFTLGSVDVNPEFQNAILGMTAGQVKTFTIPADKAYGPSNPEMIYEMDRAAFRNSANISVGQYYEMTTEDGMVMSRGRIVNVTASTVTIDENNPLAGKDLTFTIRLAGINTP